MSRVSFGSVQLSLSCFQQYGGPRARQANSCCMATEDRREKVFLKEQVGERKEHLSFFTFFIYSSYEVSRLCFLFEKSTLSFQESSMENTTIYFKSIHIKAKEVFNLLIWRSMLFKHETSFSVRRSTVKQKSNADSTCRFCAGDRSKFGAGRHSPPLPPCMAYSLNLYYLHKGKDLHVLQPNAMHIYLNACPAKICCFTQKGMPKSNQVIQNISCQNILGRYLVQTCTIWTGSSRFKSKHSFADFLGTKISFWTRFIFFNCRHGRNLVKNPCEKKIHMHKVRPLDFCVVHKYKC